MGVTEGALAEGEGPPLTVAPPATMLALWTPLRDTLEHAVELAAGVPVPLPLPLPPLLRLSVGTPVAVASNEALPLTEAVSRIEGEGDVDAVRLVQAVLLAERWEVPLWVREGEPEPVPQAVPLPPPPPPRCHSPAQRGLGRPLWRFPEVQSPCLAR